VVLYLLCYFVHVANHQEVTVWVIGKRKKLVAMWTLILQRQIFTPWTMPAGREDRS
jgi:hypothetical protein